jgi:hypothetical protein
MERTFCPTRAIPQPPPTRTRTPLPPPSRRPSSRRGSRRRVIRCWGAPLRPALCAVVKATSTPISASRPSRWCPPISVWARRVVISRNSTERFTPRCRSQSRIFGGQTDPASFLLPSRESWSTGWATGLPASFYHGIPIRPPTDLVTVFVVCSSQAVAVSLVSLSFPL